MATKTLAPFPQLVERYRRRGVPKDAPLRELWFVAKKFGISRQFLHAILRGEKGASQETEKAMSAVLGVSAETVHRAIECTKKVRK